MSYKYFQCCWLLYPTLHLIWHKDKTPEGLFPKCCFKNECHDIRAGLHVLISAHFCEVFDLGPEQQNKDQKSWVLFLDFA